MLFNCFGGGDYYSFQYSYELTHSAWIISLVLAVISIPIIRAVQNNSGSDLIESDPNLPGRDTFQLERPYSHPHEVFVPFSTKVSESPVIRTIVVLVCLALIFFPLQLALQ